MKVTILSFLFILISNTAQAGFFGNTEKRGFLKTDSSMVQRMTNIDPTAVKVEGWSAARAGCAVSINDVRYISDFGFIYASLANIEALRLAQIIAIRNNMTIDLYISQKDDELFAFVISGESLENTFLKENTIEILDINLSDFTVTNSGDVLLNGIKIYLERGHELLKLIKIGQKNAGGKISLIFNSADIDDPIALLEQLP